MKLVVGLGNPGKKYANTRHNIGWRVIRHLSLHLDAGVPVKNEKFKANVSEAAVDGERIMLAQPLTFMNLSGECVSAIQRFYKLDLADILIIHDEMDYPVGRLALAKNGGGAGHNGILSVIESLGTEDFARLRIGIGRPKPPLKKETFVLEPFEPDEQAKMDLIEERAVEAAYDWAMRGLTKAMNVWNGVGDESSQTR